MPKVTQLIGGTAACLPRHSGSRALLLTTMVDGINFSVSVTLGAFFCYFCKCRTIGEHIADIMPLHLKYFSVSTRCFSITSAPRIFDTYTNYHLIPCLFSNIPLSKISLPSMVVAASASSCAQTCMTIEDTGMQISDMLQTQFLTIPLLFPRF